MSFEAGDETRTRYLHLGKVALYRMSYTRITWVIILPRRKMSRAILQLCAIFLDFSDLVQSSLAPGRAGVYDDMVQHLPSHKRTEEFL